jgi:hypothetical protein
MADVHVQVDPWLSVSEGHRVAEVVQLGLIDKIDLLEDVTVHIDPEDDEEGPSCANLPLRDEVESILDDLCVEIGEYRSRERLVLHYLSGQIDVDIYLPLSSFTTVQASDALKGRFQSAIAQSEIFREVRLWYG